MVIDSPIISGSYSASGSYNQIGNVTITGSLAVSGALSIVGTQTVSGSIIPAVNNIYDLGDATHQFRHLYISSGSLYIDGAKVLSSTTQELQITTDAGQSIKILEAGSDTITLQSADGNITLATSGGGDVILDPNTGVIALKGTTTVYTGYKIVSSDGNPIQFGNALAVTGSIVSTNTISATSFTGSLAGTATTASSADNFTVRGTLTAQTINVQTITSSIDYVTGSTRFGSISANTHQFTGSITVSGSLAVNGSNVILSSQTSSISVATASYVQNAVTASYVQTATTASYWSGSITNALSASYATNSTTASYVASVISASYAASASNALASQTASYALTASYSANVPITSSYANNAASASYALTASYSANVPITSSYANNAASASYALTASYSANVPVTSSYANNAASSSYSLTASYAANVPQTSSYAISASNALTASYLSGYVSPFPFTGSAIISGSLTVTGSVAVSNLQGSGVRYLVTDSSGSVTAQSASAAIINNQVFTSSAGQTTFAITNGYTTGLIETFINGTKLTRGLEYTDTSGTSIVLLTGSFAGDIVEFVSYQPASGVTNNNLRQVTYFTASAGQTTFTASYVPGLLDVFYNGAKLTNATDYTAANGTSIIFTTASNAGDIVEVDVYSYQVGAFSGIGGTGVANQFAYFNTTNSITSSTAITISGANAIVTGSLLGTASYSNDAGTLDGLDSTVFTLTSSFIAQTASFTAFTSSINSFSASILTFTSSATTRLGALEAATASLYSATSSFSGRVGALESYTASLNAKTASFATTGSNNFTGVQHIADTTNPTGFDSTGSLYSEGGLHLKKDAYISSSLYIKGNLTVYGTQSVSYITSSQLNISTNIITVNTSTPSVRFGGIAVQDSGSASGLTGSLLWDSQNNNWLYSNPSGSGNYDSSMVIMGPRNSSTLGNEVGLNCNYLVLGHGSHHTTSSAIFHDGSTTCLPGSVTANGLVQINKQNEGLILTAGANTDASYMSTRANNATGWLIMGSQGTVANYIQTGTGANESAITTVGAYALALGTNQIERMRITSAGAACFACELTAKTLGTNDLILNNLNYECANYVDGTRGSWLIQEGACDLFIINQVSCKKYKFNLIEIK